MVVALFSLAVSVLVFILLFGIIKSRIVPQKALNERLRALDDDYSAATFSRGKKDVNSDVPSFRDRVIKPLKNGLGDLMTNLAPASWLSALENKLVLAGKSRVWSAQGYAVFWLIFTLLGACAAVRYVYVATNLAYVQSVIIVLLGTAFGATMPLIVLRSLIQKRQKLISRQLPEILDLLCVSVQAGLSFDAALRRIVDKMSGPLVDECGRMLEDVRMGLPRRQSLRMLADRCEVQDVTLFCTAIIQAERLGTGIGKTLSNQSANMRERRRQAVKAEAMKAPVKMLLPLVLFIFPALFVIVLLPSLLSLLKNL